MPLIRPITDLKNTKLAIVGIYKRLAEAEAQVLEGATLLDGEEVFKKLRKKYADK